MPPEEDTLGPALPDEQARRDDLYKFGGERLLSSGSASQPEGQASTRLYPGCRAVERQRGMPRGIAAERSQYLPDRLWRSSDVGGHRDEGIIFQHKHAA